MLPVVWSHQAETDLLALITYAAERHAAAAARMGRAIRASASPLPEHPPHLLKTSERMPSCREIVAHPNYIPIYRVGHASIEILRVRHARQQYP